LTVEKEAGRPKRRKTPWIIGTLMVASLAMLVVLQSTNLWKTFTIESSSDLLLLYALSSLNFIAFVVVGFVFLRSIIKLVRERRTFELGAKIKTRLLIYFFAVSLLPIIAMAVFSYLFMNRALERWFSQIPNNVIAEAQEMQQSAIEEHTATLEASAKMIAASLEGRSIDNTALARVAAAGSLAHIEILSADNRTLAVSEREIAPELRVELDRVIESIRTGNGNEPFLADRKGFDATTATMSGGRRLMIVPDPIDETNVGQIVDNSLAELDRLGQQQLTIRRVGLLTLGVLTFLLIFASTWIAFYVARGLTLPIKALAEGADEIAAGNLSHRVDVLAEDELGLLVSAFNDMSARLESNSSELRERRRYIETVLETLPTGVISFDEQGRVSTINGAATNMLGATANALSIDGLSNIVGNEELIALERLVSRARRTGQAADQIVLKQQGGNVSGPVGNERTVAVTASALPDNGGVVVVLEDLSELIAAQRSSAWQEVARRMAHEIKNPLTPIQLSAERIAKRFEKSGHTDAAVGKRIDDKGPIGDVVHESTATILREVSSLKSMVDEFSKFARLPDVKLKAGDVGQVADQAAAAFEGRSGGIEIDLLSNGTLPDVMLDAEQLKRAFGNLIENAIEAFDPAQVGRSITIGVRHDPARDLVVAEVADNGKGIPPSDLQKLFQPYFSTKGRGTGLGLAIVNRIVIEHHGKIYVSANQPTGAKFTIELPTAG
jgi:PAS domain S-box-containing protein